jgi:hypothetical protein
MPNEPDTGCFSVMSLASVRDASRALARFELLPVYDGNAGGIVAAIFEAAQAVQEYGCRFCAADVSDNSTHNFRRGIIAYFSPLRWSVNPSACEDLT